jgi:Flp pilus assembly protein TadG
MMAISAQLFRLKKDSRGATALEFAMILPAFIGLMVGGLYACIAVFTSASLQYAVEKAARCASVNTTTCSSSATTISYAKTAYYGPPAPAAAFTYSTAGCGNTVNGSVNFKFDFGMKNLTVPISASACFP